MHERIILTIVTWLALGAGPAAAGPPLSADQVADELQRIYEQTQDFKAAFTQEYQSKALGRTRTSSGFVYVKKPGLMRWDYKQPRPKHFVADGKALFIYDPDLEQVMVDRSFSGSDLSTAVTFLWGKGKLKEEFAVAFSDKVDEAHYLLEMTPKSRARFRKLWFKVERKSFRVVETVVEDPGGNTNRIRFSKMTTNVGLKAEAFKFQIPEGVDVIEAPEG